MKGCDLSRHERQGKTQYLGTALLVLQITHRSHSIASAQHSDRYAGGTQQATTGTLPYSWQRRAGGMGRNSRIYGLPVQPFFADRYEILRSVTLRAAPRAGPLESARVQHAFTALY
jgi:hypothetical protein